MNTNTSPLSCICKIWHTLIARCNSRFFYKKRRNELESFIRPFFDYANYLTRNPDVALAKIDPWEHWLNFGIYEGRIISTRLRVQIQQPSMQNSSGKWNVFHWSNQTVYVLLKNDVSTSDKIHRQILSQSILDPSIVAPGFLAFDSLRKIVSDDLYDRDGLELNSIFESFKFKPEVIIVLPFLALGGAEKYCSNLIDGILFAGLKSITVLVTEQNAKDRPNLNQFGILNSYTKVNLVFWRDVCGPGYLSSDILGRLLNLIRPDFIVIANSRLGLETIAKYGRGLGQYSKLCCLYFGLGVNSLGAPLGSYYPRRTMPFSLTLTDNELTQTVLMKRYGGLSFNKVVVIPPLVEAISELDFQRRLQIRIEQTKSSRDFYRWVWVSRIEPYKGTTLLAEIAKMRPNDKFDIFGPLENELTAVGLDLPNINYCGLIDDVSVADFSTYDGFLFTSLFEGMPNIVLEMSQHGLPMVLSRVGGLDHTFDESCVFLIDVDPPENAANYYCDALSAITKLDDRQSKELCNLAYLNALKRHGREVFQQQVIKLFS
jgi:glycosyltransferase involved in cell wall biosynthesis